MRTVKRIQGNAVTNAQTLISQDWIDAVRLRIGELPEQPDSFDIEQLRDRLTAIAWLADCPNAATLDIAHVPKSYRRHLLASAADNRYSALLIAWPPGHRTPLHDHDGLWGIELVIDGAIAIEEFSTDAGTKAESTLDHQRTLILGIGDATVFAGPGYVHSCRNLSAQQPALSLHVYGGVLDGYSAFHTHTLGRFTATRQHVGVDAVLI